MIGFLNINVYVFLFCLPPSPYIHPHLSSPPPPHCSLSRVISDRWRWRSTALSDLVQTRFGEEQTGTLWVWTHDLVSDYVTILKDLSMESINYMNHMGDIQDHNWSRLTLYTFLSKVMVSHTNGEHEASIVASHAMLCWQRCKAALPTLCSRTNKNHLETVFGEDVLECYFQMNRFKYLIQGQ